MKLRPSLKNSANTALSSLTLTPKLAKRVSSLLQVSIATALLVCGGCSPPKSAFYTKENLSESIIKITEEEYNIPIVSKLVGETIWIYLPLQEELFIKSDKPQEYVKRFELEAIDGSLKEAVLKFEYEIKETPETKETQDKKLNPDAIDKINKILRTVRRVIFNLERNGFKPKFFTVLTTDIKSGIEILDITYVEDLKKVFYGIISWTEYQHRSLEFVSLSLNATGDLEGKHINFYDVDFNDFLVEQIKQRLSIKFNRPEVEKGVDIDKEVLKSIKNVLEIYNADNFLLVDLKNLITGYRISMSRSAVLEESKE